MQKSAPEKRYFLLVMAGVLLCLPYAFHITLAPHHDALAFAIWMKEFAAQFWSGNFYPRWLHGLQDGLGRPDFYFYPPLTLWISSLFYWPYVMEAWPYFQLWATATIAISASGITCYMWLCGKFSKHVALLVSLLYITGINHLFAGLYLRSAIGEVFSYVWLPLLFMAAEDLISRKYGQFQIILRLSLLSTLIILTNIPAAIIMLPLPLFMALFMARENKAMAMLQALAALALAASLTAFYLLPILELKQYTHIGKMLENEYRFDRNFLSANPLNGLTAAMFYWSLSMTALAVYQWTMLVRRKAGRDNVNNFYAFVTIASLLMTLSISKPVWELLKPLHLLQFPYRFGLILSATMLPLIASWAAENRKSIVLPLTIAAGVLYALYLTAYPYADMAKNPHRVESYAKFKMDSDVWYAKSIQNAPEYYPEWADAGYVGNAKLMERVQEISKPFGGENFRITKGSADITIKQWGRDINLAYNNASSSTIILNRFYFPTWIALEMGEVNYKSDTYLYPSSDGLMALELPTGSGEITIKLTSTLGEIAGLIISAVTILIIFFMRIYVARCKEIM